MKTAEEWQDEFEQCGWDDIPMSGQILCIQRDAYRQGLVDAAEIECRFCRTSPPETKTGKAWWHDKFRQLCLSTPIWHRIAAHDKENADG